MSKPLFIPLKAEHFDDFASGIKTHERRVYGPGWNTGTCYVGREVRLSRGYGKRYRLSGSITSVRTVPFAEIDQAHHAALIACYGAGVVRENIIEVGVYVEGVNRGQ